MQLNIFEQHPSSVPPWVGTGLLLRNLRGPVTQQLPAKARTTKSAKPSKAAPRHLMLCDAASIADSVPQLFPEQQEDVLKAERRFFEQNKKGILFTNGTGTGKTFTGLGIVKRFALQDKTNTLIVVPTDAKAKDWIEDGAKLGLSIRQLNDTKDAGEQIVITTYANFASNQALDMREWDLLVYDEAHKLNSNGQGALTKAESRHRALANVGSMAKRKAQAHVQASIERDRKQYGEISKDTKALIQAEQARLEAKTKVVFLSATPFAYHFCLSYGDGSLLTISEGVQQLGAHTQFFIKNFGYRLRYGRLTKPESGVDQGLLEREFHQRLRAEGAISGRKLQLVQDYSRDFILLDSRLGKQIDEGWSIAYGFTDREQNDYKVLPMALRKLHTWMYQNQLLESLKAGMIIDRVRAHVAQGRKVILFHTYKKGVQVHPFYFAGLDSIEDRALLDEEIAHFHRHYPQYRRINIEGLGSPVAQLQQAFGEDLLLFNGSINKKNRRAAIKAFNDDRSGKNVILVQMEAGKEGISLHDTTGKHPRVIIQLGLPYKPTDAIQVEGRAYRTGNQTDAIFEYPVLLTSFERFAFGNKINQRVRTAENLAMGDEARNLEVRFKEGYLNAEDYAPSAEQGTGGKDLDGQFSTLSEFEKAKTYYFARGKTSGKRDQRAGIDYFATPEPLGLKMVEWLDAQSNDDLLEPSAGHGAIARFFPGDTANTFVEPSVELSSELSVQTNGQVLTQQFEELHLVRKFDGIAMNPPFGQGGAMAMRHIAKAFQHLRHGGRIVAIYPNGPSAEKAFNKWYESTEAKTAYLRADITLPSCTFERAGTAVSTRLLVIDKLMEDTAKQLPHLTGYKKYTLAAENIEELFEKLEEREMPSRVKVC